MKNSQIGEFHARLFVIDGRYVKTKFWSNEMEPMDCRHRSVDEWAEESVTSHFGPECFDIPTEGNYQALVHAKIVGSFDYQGEYDEDIEVVEVACEQMPDEYADFFRGDNDLYGMQDYNEDIERDATPKGDLK